MQIIPIMHCAINNIKKIVLLFAVTQAYIGITKDEWMIDRSPLTFTPPFVEDPDPINNATLGHRLLSNGSMTCCRNGAQPLICQQIFNESSCNSLQTGMMFVDGFYTFIILEHIQKCACI